MGLWKKFWLLSSTYASQWSLDASMQRITGLSVFHMAILNRAQLMSLVSFRILGSTTYKWLSRSEGKPGFSSLKYCRCGGFEIFPLILWKILSSKGREKCPPLELNPGTCFSWTEYDRNCDLCVCDFQTRHKRYCRFLVILSPSSLTVGRRRARRAGRQLTRAPSNPPERFMCHEKEATCRHPVCELSS